MSIWNVAIYARVSTDKYEQRESIPAQIQGLKEWILKKSKEEKNSIYNLVNIYEDCGFSGSNFERQSFIQMKEDIENKKINMILTRDLSRFSRNYIMAGYYLEDYFKAKDIRFVSVLDNVDTLHEFNDIIPFKNILNEMYIKDCSRRTRDGLKQRMIRGSSIASKPPYGYKFEESFEENIKIIKLIPAENEATKIVVKIYELYLKGWGFKKIANYLNSIEVRPPSWHVKNFGKSKFFKWNSNSIRYILTNPKYSGQMIQGRWRKVSYKLKTVKALPKDQWIYGGEFKGIIPKEIFDEVQELIKKRQRSLRYKNDKVHLFSGVLKCGDCGGSMCYRKNYNGYKCTNSQTGKKKCTAHSIKEEYIKQIIINDLINYTKDLNKEIFYDELKELIKSTNHAEELKSINSKLKEIDINIKRIYEDRLKNIVNEKNFKMILKEIQDEQNRLEKRKGQIENEINSNREHMLDLIYSKIDHILSFNELKRNDIEELVEKIIIFEDKDVKEKHIQVFYKFNVQ